MLFLFNLFTKMSLSSQGIILLWSSYLILSLLLLCWPSCTINTHRPSNVNLALLPRLSQDLFVHEDDRASGGIIIFIVTVILYSPGLSYAFSCDLLNPWLYFITKVALCVAALLTPVQLKSLSIAQLYFYAFYFPIVVTFLQFRRRLF
jgi:hypothetical protein